MAEDYSLDIENLRDQTLFLYKKVETLEKEIKSLRGIVFMSMKRKK